MGFQYDGWVDEMCETHKDFLDTWFTNELDTSEICSLMLWNNLDFLKFEFVGIGIDPSN